LRDVCNVFHMQVLIECCYLGFKKNGKHLLGTVYFNNKYVCAKTLIN